MARVFKIAGVVLLFAAGFSCGMSFQQGRASVPASVSP